MGEGSNSRRWRLLLKMALATMSHTELPKVCTVKTMTIAQGIWRNGTRSYTAIQGCLFVVSAYVLFMSLKGKDVESYAASKHAAHAVHDLIADPAGHILLRLAPGQPAPGSNSCCWSSSSGQQAFRIPIPLSGGLSQICLCWTRFCWLHCQDCARFNAQAKTTRVWRRRDKLYGTALVDTSGPIPTDCSSLMPPASL
jgi:hypothetical protein